MAGHKLCSSFCSDIKREDDFTSSSEQFHIPTNSYNYISHEDSIRKFNKSQGKKPILKDRNFESEEICHCSENGFVKSPWMYNPVFSRYWKTYDMCWNWFRFHQETIKETPLNFHNANDMKNFNDRKVNIHDSCCSSSRHNNPYLDHLNYNYTHSNRDTTYCNSINCDINSRNKTSARRNTSKKRRKNKRKNKRIAKKRKHSLSHCDVKAESEIEMEFAPEFMQFLKESAQHRKERDEQEILNPNESANAATKEAESQSLNEASHNKCEADTHCSEDDFFKRPSFLLIADSNRSHIQEHLDTKRIRWGIERKIYTTNDLLKYVDNEEAIKSMRSFTKVVIMLGTNDINQSSRTSIAKETYINIRSACQKLNKSKVKCTVLQIPPNGDVTKNVDVQILNRKIAKLVEDNVEVIIATFESVKNDCLLKDDKIHLTTQGGKIYAKLINDSYIAENIPFIKTMSMPMLQYTHSELIHYENKQNNTELVIKDDQENAMVAIKDIMITARKHRFKSVKQCTHFSKDGRCHFGEKCLFLHDRARKRSSSLSNDGPPPKKNGRSSKTSD